MTESGPTSRLDGANRCGNCGRAVTPVDIMCPACGVVLAAYQPPAGAAVGNSAATRPIGTPPAPLSAPAIPDPVTPPASDAIRTPPAPVAPKHTPRSMSPIGDALKRARQVETTIGTPADRLASSDTADELASMATTDSELSRQIDAQLSGAKVTFEGATPAITSDPEATPATPPPPTAREIAMERTRLARVAQQERDAAGAANASPQPAAFERIRARYRTPVLPGGIRRGTLLRALPFILIALFVVLGSNRAMTLLGILFGLAGGIVLLIVILNAATRTGRKTTHMPKDDWRPRKR